MLLLLLLLLFWCLLLVGAGLQLGDLLGVKDLVAFLAPPVFLALLALAVLAGVAAIWLVVTRHVHRVRVLLSSFHGGEAMLGSCARHTHPGRACSTPPYTPGPWLDGLASSFADARPPSRCCCCCCAAAPEDVGKGLTDCSSC